VWHTTRKNSDLMEINRGLQKLADEKGLTYIDLFSLFADEQNQMNAEYSNDGLHVNGKGYVMWRDAIRNYIDE